MLDTVRDRAPLRVVTEVDAKSGALLARNGFHTDFGSHVAFADVNLRPHTYTCDRTEFLRAKAEALRAALEEHAWDGQWYRRAYFDDGTPLGSAANDGCRIDSLAQSWAVLSGSADPERARLAMDAVQQHLGRMEDRLILLFTPPFDRSALEPGYIKGYVPGIRENGGSIRTPLPGWCRRLRTSAGATRRRHCSTCSTPSATPTVRKRQVCSAVFQRTTAPRWGQTAEHS